VFFFFFGCGYTCSVNSPLLIISFVVVLYHGSCFLGLVWAMGIWNGNGILRGDG